MNEQIEIQFKNIQQQIQTLLKDFAAVQKENQKLKKEVEDLNNLKEKQKEQLEILKQKTEVSQLGVDSWSKEDRIALEKRIDTYLKEIDKCISLLNAE
jgi:hypothetical protein